MSCGEMWSKICHVETFLHMLNVETIFFCHYSCWFVAKSALLPFTLYWRKNYFVAIYALLCGEKFIQKLCVWRKKDKYQVWSHYILVKNALNEFSQVFKRFMIPSSQLFEMASRRNIQSHFWAFNIQCNIGSKLEHLTKIFFLNTFFHGNDWNFLRW